MTTAFKRYVNPTRVQVQAPYALLYGSQLRITNNLDLSSKNGGWLHLKAGRYSTNALSAGLDILIRELLSDGSGTPYASLTGGTSYSNQLINYASGYSANVQSLAFDGQAYSTAFAHGDWMAFWGVTAIPSANGSMANSNIEFLRCSAGTSTPFVPDMPTRFAHDDNEYFTAADVFPRLWLEGGKAYSLTFDAGAVTTTSGVFLVSADLVTYDYDYKLTV